MSLDVDLTGATQSVSCECPTCGNQHTCTETEVFYTANYTHNLGAMAKETGLYMPLWRPEEIGITKAAQLIAPLRKGLAVLRDDPRRFEKMNPANGWGSFRTFVPWVERYLAACEAYPDADVSVSR